MTWHQKNREKEKWKEEFEGGYVSWDIGKMVRFTNLTGGWLIMKRFMVNLLIGVVIFGLGVFFQGHFNVLSVFLATVPFLTMFTSVLKFVADVLAKIEKCDALAGVLKIFETFSKTGEMVEKVKKKKELKEVAVSKEETVKEEKQEPEEQPIGQNLEILKEELEIKKAKKVEYINGNEKYVFYDVENIKLNTEYNKSKKNDKDT